MSDKTLVSLIEGEARVDSRNLVQELGIEHESLVRLIDKNYNDFSDLGILRFEIGVLLGRGQPQRFTYLNEDQCYFALTLSKNTFKSVALKKRLVQEFGRLRRGEIEGVQSNNSETVYQRQSFPVFQNEALGFTQCMIEEDDYCKAHRVSLDQLIKVECGLRNPVFIRELTNLTFRIFTGFEVKDFRRGWVLCAAHFFVFVCLWIQIFVEPLMIWRFKYDM